MLVTRFGRDQNGVVLAEVSILIPVIFIFILGAIDFLFAFYEWNAAAKAVEIGARIAAVSDPVATGLNNLSANVVSSSVLQGDPMPSFTVTCSGSATTCTCTDGGAGTCTGIGANPPLDQNAMNRIIFGRDENNQCGDAASQYYAGMCDMFARINSATTDDQNPAKHVVITYTQTGLGYAGRATPVPTITVSLQNLPFRFFFLGDLRGFANRNIPAQTTTITGEALSSNAQ